MKNSIIKKEILIIFILIIFSLILNPINLKTHALSLKGGVNKDFVPQGFYGTWGVISKLKSSNNPSLFNTGSKDIWVLSGQGNVLILENKESGAKSEVVIKDKNKEKDTLKFTREKIVEKDKEKTIYKETVDFVLMGNTFTGSDYFVIETWVDNNLMKKSEAHYSVSGVKISGTNP